MFSPFGEIQDIWVVRDKHTKESKGIAFVKFARSSQACRAMEEMHGQCLTPATPSPSRCRVPGTGCPGCVGGEPENGFGGAVRAVHSLAGAVWEAPGIPGRGGGRATLQRIS